MTKGYYIKIRPVLAPDSKPEFVGKFDNRNLAKEEIENARKMGQEIVEVEKGKPTPTPRNAEKALYAEILHSTDAKRKGLTLPEEENGSNKRTNLRKEIPKPEPEEKEIPRKDRGHLGRIPSEELGLTNYSELRETLWVDEVIIIDNPEFPGLQEWLIRHGIRGRHTQTPFLDRDQIIGKIVVGDIPSSWRHLPREIWVIDLPNRSDNQKGIVMNAQEMEEAGAKLLMQKTMDVTRAIPRIL